jgi:hypothetical protein
LDDTTICGYSALLFSLVSLGLNLGCFLAYRHQNRLQQRIDHQNQSPIDHQLNSENIGNNRKNATTRQTTTAAAAAEEQHRRRQLQSAVEMRLTVYTLLTFLAQLLCAIYMVINIF